MAKARMRAVDDSTLGMNFDPTAPVDGGSDYTPPSGNTGVSGYIPGGVPMPPGGVQQEPAFNGDYISYYKSILGDGPTNMQTGLQNKDALERYGGKLQIASDGTWRGRINDIPGIGMMTLIGDRQTWGDGPWAFRTGQEQFGTGGGGGGPQMGQSSLPPAAPQTDFRKILEQFYSGGGGFNQDIVNRRTENASANLRRFSDSRKDQNRAALASRGTLGSGPEKSMTNRVDEDIFNQYSDAVSGIYADESENADERLIQALSLAAGLDTADADRALGYLRANNDYTLGQGNLALGNSRAQNDYNLGLGDFGLRREQLENSINSGNIDQMIELLKIYLGGANTSAGGHY